MIAIIDYGMGNLHSVSKAVERLGYEAVVTADAAGDSGSGRRDLAGRRRVRRCDGASAGIRVWTRYEALCGVRQAAARHLPRHAAAVQRERGARPA